MSCKDDVENWMSKLATSSNIKYNMESGGRSRTGKWVSFTRWCIITCMPVQTKKLTKKKQEAATKKVQDKKQLQRQAHTMNTVPEQLVDVEYEREKPAE